MPLGNRCDGHICGGSSCWHRLRDALVRTGGFRGQRSGTATSDDAVRVQPVRTSNSPLHIRVDIDDTRRRIGVRIRPRCGRRVRPRCNGGRDVRCRARRRYRSCMFEARPRYAHRVNFARRIQRFHSNSPDRLEHGRRSQHRRGLGHRSVSHTRPTGSAYAARVEQSKSVVVATARRTRSIEKR